MRTEAELETWLSTAVDHERAGTFRDIRIERFRSFLGLLPPPPAPCTIGGTKGKGSTVRLLEAAIGVHGYATLAFTSPHVHSVRERWRINGEPAAMAQLVPVALEIAAIESRSGMQLTYFERTAAMAVLLAVAIRDCFLLWEVGLGGRLDCANALDCRLAIMTHLSHDHREILGPDLRAIAGEKVPIARAGRPLLIAPQSAAGAVAFTQALAQQFPTGLTPTWVTRHGQSFTLALLGEHQQDNASTALAAAALIVPDFDEDRARRGMATATLAARCQLVTVGARRLLIDGAHNGPSIAATLAVAESQLRAPWRLVLGTATDKEIDEIAAVMPPGIEIIRCGYDSPRARGPQQWPAVLMATPWCADINAAIAHLVTLDEADVCITGSFYLAAEALRAVNAGTDFERHRC
jgi:dihydrofolate synthase/folylpolyglutamate synthase